MNDALQVILQHMDLSDARVPARARHWNADWHWYAFRRLGQRQGRARGDGGASGTRTRRPCGVDAGLLHGETMQHRR